MPPVAPQGSRGGLVTAVVIFTILFVVSAIFAIYYGVDDSKNVSTIAALKTQSKQFYLDTTSNRVQQLLSEARSGNLHEPTALAASINDADELADQIVGSQQASTTQPTSAITDARQALDNAQAKVQGVTLPPDLVGAVDTLSDYAASEQQQLADSRKAQDVAAASASQQIADAQKEVEKAQQDVASANKQKQTLLDQIQHLNTDYNNRLTNYGQGMDKERAHFNDELHRRDIELAEASRRLDDAKAQINTLENKLASHRVSVEDATVRQADGVIVSVASENIVYINLGMGDHIEPGMTFEVYNQNTGIPPLGDGMSPDDMPVGEASIEVQRVDAASSQCRVIRLSTAEHIHEGDYIANLVYDRNTKYNFFVYGKFDLGQTGHPTDTDREKIEGLIVQWGGKIQHKIDVDTDFVVMGAEPAVQEFSADELQDPFNVRLKEDEEKQVQDYQNVLNQAKELHIPVMNQNRFLYFCGYYQMSQR